MLISEKTMKEFNDYDIKFPELVYDILDYFRLSNTSKKVAKKSVGDYCAISRFSNTKKTNGELIQPYVVNLICENLVRKRMITRIKNGEMVDGWDANYIYSPQNDEFFLSKPDALVFSLNCMAYGFPYIYASFKNDVLPVIVKDKKGDVTMGTCFRFSTGILTAKHCLEVAEVSIEGYTAEQLQKYATFISKDPNIDLAYIELQEHSRFVLGDANVLDEVLVMGYPKIPMFNAFCAAERAAISSIPTRGAVASLADQYLSSGVGQLMLVTARIRGGNSGGPIINSNGQVVGVAFSEPMSEGNYDEMGYGVAYPISVLGQLLDDCEVMQVNYVDHVQ